MEDIFEELTEENERNEVSEEENDENKDPDENTEHKKRIAKAKIRVVNKRPTLDTMRLTSPHGISAIENIAQKVVFKGNGNEKEDLNKIMSVLQYWTHRLYPRMTLGDCLEKIETLGKKRPAIVYMTKMRSGMLEENAGEEDADNPSSSVTTDEPGQQVLTDEQRDRMLKNKKLAQERRASKMQAIKEQDEAFNKLINS